MDFCAQAEDYVAGRLSNAEVRAFEGHAQTCETCGKALLRRKAVERAAIIMRRNQNARAIRPTETTARNVAVEPTPADDAASISTVQSRELFRSDQMEHEAPRGAFGPKRVATVLLIVVLAGGALLWRSRTEAPEASIPVAAEPPEPELTPPPRAEPSPPQPTVTAPSPDLTPTLEAPPPAPKPEAPPPAPKPPQAKAPTQPANPNADLPLDADWETIVATVNGKKCGPAVAPLRARVTKDGTDAESWALLTQCYAKRKRWQNVLDAYAMVTQYGDGELVASLQKIADEARAALQPAPPADAPAPTEETPQ